MKSVNYQQSTPILSRARLSSQQDRLSQNRNQNQHFNSVSSTFNGGGDTQFLWSPNYFSTSTLRGVSGGGDIPASIPMTGTTSSNSSGIGEFRFSRPSSLFNHQNMYSDTEDRTLRTPKSSETRHSRMIQSPEGITCSPSSSKSQNNTNENESPIRRKSNKQSFSTVIFNKITDVKDKEEVNLAIQQLHNPKQRIEVIDKVIKRRNEIKNAEQIMQISRCAPLVQRFMKKIRRNQQIHALASSNSNPTTITGSDSSTPIILSVGQPDMQSSTNVKKIQFQDDLTDSQTADPNAHLISAVQTPRESKGTGLLTSSLKSGSHNVVSKGIALSLFYKTLNNNNNNNQTQLKQPLSPPVGSTVTSSSSISDQKISEDITALNTVPTLQPFDRVALRRKTRNMSMISRDNLLEKHRLPSHIHPDSEDAKFHFINLKSVSENSQALEERGKLTSRNHAIALLKDVQKLNLAQHFKSKSMNTHAFHDSQANTFNFQQVLKAKDPKAKVNSVQHASQLEAREKLLNKFSTYKDQHEIISIVSKDISNFLTSTKPLNVASSSSSSLAQLPNYHEEVDDAGAVEPSTDTGNMQFSTPTEFLSLFTQPKFMELQQVEEAAFKEVVQKIQKNQQEQQSYQQKQQQQLNLPQQIKSNSHHRFTQSSNSANRLHKQSLSTNNNSINNRISSSTQMNTSFLNQSEKTLNMFHRNSQSTNELVPQKKSNHPTQLNSSSSYNFLSLNALSPIQSPRRQSINLLSPKFNSQSLADLQGDFSQYGAANNNNNNNNTGLGSGSLTHRVSFLQGRNSVIVAATPTGIIGSLGQFPSDQQEEEKKKQFTKSKQAPNQKSAQQLPQQQDQNQSNVNVVKSQKPASFSTSNFQFKNPSTKKPYRINSSQTSRPSLRFQQKDISSLNDLVHKTTVAPDQNSSFASFTEIKLDHLYKQSTDLKKMIKLTESESKTDRIQHTKAKSQYEQNIKDYNSTRNLIQDTFFTKVRQQKNSNSPYLQDAW